MKGKRKEKKWPKMTNQKDRKIERKKRKPKRKARL